MYNRKLETNEGAMQEHNENQRKNAANRMAAVAKKIKARKAANKE